MLCISLDPTHTTTQAQPSSKLKSQFASPPGSIVALLSLSIWIWERINSFMSQIIYPPVPASRHTFHNCTYCVCLCVCVCLRVWGKQRPPKIALQLIIRQNALFASAHTHTHTMHTMDNTRKRLHRNTFTALPAVTHSDFAAHLRAAPEYTYILHIYIYSSRSRPLGLSLGLAGPAAWPNCRNASWRFRRTPCELS